MKINRKFNFTKKRIEALPPNDRNSKSTDQEYTDTAVPGLKLFVSKNGRKSFHFRYFFKKKRVIKIADFETMTIVEVRNIALQYRGLVSQGVDPHYEREKMQGAPNIEEFAESYIEWAKSQKRSWKDDWNKLSRDIIPAFGHYKLDEVTPRQIQAYLMKIKDRNTGANSNRHRSLLSKMFSMALLWGVINTNNPVSKVPKYPESAGRLRYLNAEEIRQFIRELDGYGDNVSALLLKFLLFTGLRLGESTKLQWADISPDGSVHIRMENAKSKKDRYVQLNTLAQEVIDNLRRIRINGNPYIFPGPVVGSHLGRPTKLFKSVTKRVKLDDCCIHTLRHTFASLSVQAGNDLTTVQAQLGHASYSTTQRYVHLSPERVQRATENVANVIEEAMI